MSNEGDLGAPSTRIKGIPPRELLEARRGQIIEVDAVITDIDELIVSMSSEGT